MTMMTVSRKKMKMKEMFDVFVIFSGVLLFSVGLFSPVSATPEPEVENSDVLKELGMDIKDKGRTRRKIL